MTIFNPKKLKQGSFRDAPFHIQDTTVDGGRKTVTHEYPDSNGRVVEDLGKLEKTFTITVLVDANANYSDRDTLIDALEIEGTGILIHPEYGTQEVSLKGYSINNTINRLGAFTFNLTFEIAQKDKLPSTTQGNKGFLANLKTKILGDNEAAFDAGWESVKGKKQQFDSAVATTQAASREMQRISAVVEGAVDGISDYVTTLNELVDDATTLVQTPSNLSAKLRTAFDNLEVAYNNSLDVFNVVTGMFGFDIRDRNAAGNSGQQQEIKNNQDQTNNFINASAMALAYNAAVGIDFTNFDEVNNINTQLEEGFSLLPDNLDRDILASLQEMRIETTTILSRTGLTLPRVTTFKTRRTSLNVLTYNLYGSLANKNIIRELNQLTDTSRVEGEIKILSNV